MSLQTSQFDCPSFKWFIQSHRYLNATQLARDTFDERISILTVDKPDSICEVEQSEYDIARKEFEYALTK